MVREKKKEMGRMGKGEGRGRRKGKMQEKAGEEGNKKGRTRIVYGLQDMIWQYITLQMFLLALLLLEPL